MSLAEELSQAAYLDAPGKAELYNFLLDAGYTDAQIRSQAERMFGDQGASWSQLTGLAQSLRQPVSTVIPEALTTQEVQQFSSSNPLEKLYNDPRFLEAQAYAREYGAYSVIIDGTVYNVLSDGSVETITPTDPTMQGKSTGATIGLFSPTGETIVDPYFNKGYGTTNPLTNAVVGGTLGLALGPAVLGLSAPAAAAIAAGAPRLNETGNLAEAARAAALAGLSAYGAEALAGSFANQAYDTAFAAADAAQLANQGLSATQIAQNLSTYVDPSLAASLANTAADQAFALADASQLAKQGISVNQIEQVLTASGVSPTVASNMANLAVDTVSIDPQAVPQISATDIVSDLQFQRQTGGQSGQVTTSPGAVEVTGTRLAETALPAAAATGGGLLGGTIATLPSIAPSPSRVEVHGSRLPTENLTTDDLLSALGSGVTAALPAVTGGTTQQVNVPGSREPTQSTSTGTVGGAVGALIPGIQPSVPTAPERVEVPGQRVTEGTTLPSVISAVLPGIPSTVTQPLPEVAKPPAAKSDSLFTPNDLLKLLALISTGTAAGNMAGGGNIPVRGLPPSDTLIGSTTPQFGPDYYAAVQQYYNAFMPETPRNVAGPLQQWYENKFGA